MQHTLKAKSICKNKSHLQKSSTCWLPFSQLLYYEEPFILKTPSLALSFLSAAEMSLFIITLVFCVQCNSTFVMVLPFEISYFVNSFNIQFLELC